MRAATDEIDYSVLAVAVAQARVERDRAEVVLDRALIERIKNNGRFLRPDPRFLRPGKRVSPCQ